MESNKFEPIDLGLSVKWASCNLGAESFESTGDYYAWGEVVTKNQYSWQSYRWSKDAYDTQTKYNTKYDFGNVDFKITLEKDDDVAYIKLGGGWRLPTVQEWYELFEKCIWKLVILNDTKGFIVKSRTTDNSIFLPFAGMRYSNQIGDIGKFGFYWSSSLDPGNPDHAWSADLGESGPFMFGIQRYRGYTIRPVTDI